MKLFDKIFLNSLSPVIHPAFVQAIKDKHHPATIYLKKVELLTALIWPAFATIAILADPLCRVVLGPGWDAAPVIVQLLALIGIARPFTQMNQALFIALGELRLSTRLDVQHHITRVALASVAALISLEAVCIALAVSYVIDAIRQTRAFARSTGYDKHQLSKLALNAFLLTACTAGPAGVTLYLFANDSAVLQLTAAAAVGAVGFVLAVCVMRNVLFFEAQKALSRIF